MNNIFSLLFLSSIFINASSLLAYDDDTLEIFSKIMPRVILMSSKKDELVDEVRICILHESVDENLAQSLINKITKNHPNGIKNYKISLTSSNYSDMNSCANTQLLFIFNSNEKNIKKSLDYSTKNNFLTMSYDPKLLKYGVAISLFLGRKITPYINVDSVRNNGIQLSNILLRISKIYSKDDK